MAFGLSPKHIEHFDSAGLSAKESLVIAFETLKDLGWKIGNIAKNGIKAYTHFSSNSWSEEILIYIEKTQISLKSESNGNQLINGVNNRQNTEAFIARFKSLQQELEPSYLESSYSELETRFTENSEELHFSKKQSGKEKILDFFSLFIPRNGFFISPILLNVNILIFILMAMSGVNILMPDNESLLLWGANFRPVTLDGEWWRLISSCFLHIGLLHLLMNMYALLYIGVLLEPYLGKARFLSAYLLSGLAGSTASLYWNELTISAGASGAIFGMYGVFLAMLTTNLIEKSTRKTMLSSIVIFVGYNLMYGLKGGIDNAAHIGGLLSGLLIGYAFYPSLLKPEKPILAQRSIALLSLFILSISTLVLVYKNPGDLLKYQTEMEEFALLEEKALGIYNLPKTSTDLDYLNEIRNTGIPSWKANIELLERMEQLDLPTDIHSRITKLKDYCNLRIKVYELIQKGILEKTDFYYSEIEQYNLEIEQLITDLNN
ncbi:rhomboid family intramembrane serine protease [Croceimicrobium hydrocarbonivorans]|nr:rhomboid family intramembrane serine protease [Croceimicrobium hydrocarbonivorans]